MWFSRGLLESNCSSLLDGNKHLSLLGMAHMTQDTNKFEKQRERYRQRKRDFTSAGSFLKYLKRWEGQHGNQERRTHLSPLM